MEYWVELDTKVRLPLGVQSITGGNITTDESQEPIPKRTVPPVPSHWHYYLCSLYKKRNNTLKNFFGEPNKTPVKPRARRYE